MIELILAMTLGAILLLAMTSQFVVNIKFQNAINNEIAIARESEIAIYNMTQTLRFALPTPAPSTVDASGNNYANSITAVIEGNPNHLPNITSNTSVEYGLDNASNTLYYISDTNNQNVAPIILASHIIHFVPSWDSVNNNFNVTLTALKGNRTVTLTTTIHALPN